MQQCQTALASWYTGNADSHDKQCVLISGNLIQMQDHMIVNGGTPYVAYGSAYSFTGSPPSPPTNPCLAAWPATTINVGGKTTRGSSTCSGAVPDGGGAGGTVQCALSINPETPPTVDPQTGAWSTWVTVGASGNTCGGGNAVTDGNGDTLKPTPFIPTLPPTTVTPPPALCTGGACYDPKADQYCGSSGGVQFCVPGASARTNAGGCSSTGGATLCAGTPQAPAPSPVKVPDPATEIKSSDKFTQADPATGNVIPVNVVVFATDGQVTNGAKPGDSQPAPASTSPAPDKGSASGGVDCNSPPVCTGDAPVCAVVQQGWLARCGSSLADKNANGQPDWTEVKDSDGDQYATTTTPVGDVFTTETVGTSSLNEAGFAGNTCPALPVANLGAYGNIQFGDQDFWCKYLGIIRACVLLCAAFVSVKILAGSKT